MNDGWIKIYRALIEWEWYDDSNTKSLFIHLLISANYENKSWRGISIKRGQYHTSIEKLSSILGMSIKSVRNSLDKLILTGEIKTKGASNGTMITVCKYDNYQSNDEVEGQAEGQAEGQTKGKQRANKGQTKGNNIINKEIKEIKEEKEIKKESKRKPKSVFIPPSVDDVINYFKEFGYTEQSAITMFNTYNVADWHDTKNNKISNWKQKAHSVWFKDENKISNNKKPDKYTRPTPCAENNWLAGLIIS